MAVFRVNKNKNYTCMSNYHLKDQELSLKAIGLLSKILSLPDDWDYSLNGLVAICKEDIRAVKSALKELQEKGYIKVTKTPPQQGYNRFTYTYDIYEQPIQNEGVQNVPLQSVSIQKDTQLNTKQLNTNKLNTTDDIYSYYENFIGIMNTTTYQTIESYLKDGMTEELIKLAIDKAVDNGARKWSYIKAILNNWNSSNIKTVSDYEREEKPGKSVLDKWAEEMEKKENGGKAI
jgi:DnaD/phage-associated family protein